MAKSKAEKVEEKKFVKLVKDDGGEAIKLGGAGPFQRTGDPDRMALGLYATIVFFEFKRRGKVATELQKSRHRKLIKLGFKVHVVYTAREAFEIFKEEIKIRRLYSKVISKGINKIRAEPASSRLFSFTRVGKDSHHSFHIQDIKKPRASRRAARRRKQANRLQRMAS